MKKQLICICMAALLSLSLLTGCGAGTDTGDTAGTEAKNVTVRLSEVTHSVFYAPQYVAMSQGFFADEGLDIELSNGGGADKVMTAVVSGGADIGLAGPESCIYIHAQGKDDLPVIFAQLTKRDGSFLVGREPEPDFQWENLKGKKVLGGRAGGMPQMVFEYILKKNGIDPKTDLSIDQSINFGLTAAAFASNDADYTVEFEPFATALEQEGNGHVAASLGESSGYVPYTAYCAKKSYIEKNSETIEKFTRAIYKGQKWVKSHTSREIAEAIQSFFPSTSVESIEKSVQSYKDIDAWNETPVLKEESFDKLQLIMTEAGELTQKAPYNKIVNNTYAEKVIK